MSDLPPPSSPPDLPPPAPPEIVPATPAPQPPVVVSSDSSPPPPEPVFDGEDPVAENADEKTLGLVMYLLPLLGVFSLWSAPGAQGVALVAPLVLWLIKKEHSRYLDAAGKEVVNFNICAVVAFIGLRILWIIGTHIWLGWLFATIWFLAWIAWLANTIISAVNANGGKLYRFPLSYRIIK